MAEEQRLQEPGGHTLCANNCGFFGSPTTLNLCSKCYKDHCLKEQQMSQAKLAVENTLKQSDFSESESESSISSLPDSLILPEDVLCTTLAPTETVPSPPEPSHPNRCGACRRRVGLTGFTCRCGTTFCGSHRYAEQHGCTFDYKGLGKEEIAKANPVVKGEKLQKI